MRAGNRILLADGTISIEVLEIVSERELRGRVLNSKSLVSFRLRQRHRTCATHS